MLSYVQRNDPILPGNCDNFDGTDRYYFSCERDYVEKIDKLVSEVEDLTETEIPAEREKISKESNSTKSTQDESIRALTNMRNAIFTELNSYNDCMNVFVN